MPRHDRAHSVHHTKRASGGNKRRVPAHEKSRNKRYAQAAAAAGKGRA